MFYGFDLVGDYNREKYLKLALNFCFTFYQSISDMLLNGKGANSVIYVSVAVLGVVQ